LAKGDTKKQGEYNEAVKGLSATDWFEKGYAYHEAKEYQDAINAYTKAIELSPKNPVGYYNRGIAYRELGNYNQAIADYTNAIKLDHKDALTYKSRGSAYGLLGNHNQAIADYTRAIEIQRLITTVGSIMEG
jgi:tetratricopeptide (TPR) repeat protein